MAQRSPSPSKSATRPACLCGCGDTPKGKKARFLPGHDARYHSAQKKAKAEKAAARQTAKAARPAKEVTAA